MKTKSREFTAALEAGDHAALVATLAPDVVARLAVHALPIEGGEVVGRLLGVVLETLRNVRGVDELHSDDRRAWLFTASVADEVDAEGMVVVQESPAGVSALTVFLRPLEAVQAIGRHVGGRHAEWM
jgi:hypothetical protein